MSWRTVEGEARGAGQSPEASEEGGGILTGAGGGAGCSGNTIWGEGRRGRSLCSVQG